ncbi:uncharacterized protein [Anabrus simplex]|uniref:uncharacterized protein n=1 Tax=Anabrus simplex TaxID=316456 RepID=UPI0035A33B43
MSDMEEVFHNAWLKVMKLFCSWHVDRAWRKNLCKIKGREKQAEIYKIIRTLMQERDEEAFRKMFDEALRLLKEDPDTLEFYIYFENNYWASAPSWAYCYRQHSGLNTNMHLERMPGVIKHIYLKGNKPKRLDIAIHALMRYLRDKLYDRLIHLNKGKVTSKLSAIRQRHKASFQLDPEDAIYDNNVWIVQSKHSNELYKIRRMSESLCKCELLCTECETCLHAFTCSCPDSSIKFNMCKHIHLICRVASREPSSAAESTDNNLIIHEASTTDRKQRAIIQELQCPGAAKACDSKAKRRVMLLDKFSHILDEAESDEDFDIIDKRLQNLLPTIQSRKSPSSLPPVSPAIKSKFEPQNGLSHPRNLIKRCRYPSQSPQPQKSKTLQ